MKKAMLMVSVLIIGTLWVYAADAAPAGPEQNASLISNMTAADLETRGDILRAERDYPEAIRYYTEAMRKNPKNSMLRNKIGITEMKRGNNAVADVNFQKAVKLDSKNADALNNIGVVAFFGKNFGKSVKFYKKALAIDETNATYHSNLGTAWFSQKKLERAMSEYARAMELDPEVFLKSNQGGSIARVSSIEDRGAYEYML